MLATIAHINNLIVDDPDIASMLSEYMGGPALAFQVVPEDMQMPYVVTTVLTNSKEANLVLDRMMYQVDVFVDNGDIELACKLADRVDALLDMEKLPELGVGIWREIKLPIVETDPGIQHIMLQFLVRHI